MILFANGKHEIQLLDRPLNGPSITDEIFRHVPSPKALAKAAILFSAEEEAALDQAYNLMWPLHISEPLKKRYTGKGFRVKTIEAEISFPKADGSEILLSFKVV